ncbi:MAG: phosphotransferase, partial [Acidimicrobiia bacterium]
MSSAGDLIDIRPEETFNVVRVAEFLAGKVDGAVGVPSVRQFSGGHANLTYLLEYPDVDLVLRRPPLGPVAPGSHDMGREFAVLSRLYQAFPPAPRAFVLCDDPAVIGSPFFVMEKRQGVVIRGAVPALFGG